MADKLSRKRTVGDPPTSAQRFARNALWLIALNLFLVCNGVNCSHQISTPFRWFAVSFFSAQWLFALL